MSLCWQMLVASGGHIVTVLIVSMAVFGERLSVLQVIGAMAIVGGIAVLALTERRETPFSDASSC